MPTVEIKRKLLLKKLGKDEKFSEKNFADLCFDFGIELDEVTSEYEMLLHNKGGILTDSQKQNISKSLKKLQKKSKLSDPETKQKELLQDLENADKDPLYKIDVPANRYDLLCVEGLTRALRIFEGNEKHPPYTIINKDDEKSMIIFNVKTNNCKKIREFAVGAILRDIDLDNDERYNSFIKLQEKLHFNICRKRELVAIGTHDLDTLKPPFLFDARNPNDIKFRALKEAKERTAKELFAWYKNKDYRDMNGNDICAVKEYLPIIENSSVYPIIYDNNNVVLSLPPIINGEHSKITQKTKNVFIECTATDRTKANIVLNTIVTMFSEYCEKKFTVEAVKVIYEGNDKPYITPNFESHKFETTVEYINKNLGTQLSSKDIINLLYRMGLEVEGKANNLYITAPPTRSDILHAVDIVEDVAIAYGYNNLTFRLPEHATTGKEFVLNSISDKIRQVVALCGYVEVLNWALISKKEAFEYMLIDEKEKEEFTVKLNHPKATQFEICRTNLLPGVFKTLSANIGQKNVSLPLYLFEVGDVVFCDKNTDEYEVGARNERRLAAIICSRQKSRLEYIHGLLDRIMEQNEIEFLPQIAIEKKYNNKFPDGSNGKRYYSIREANKPTFFPKRQAEILVDGKAVGYFGIINPKVVKNFGISTITPCIISALEINIECFVKRSKK